MFRKMRNLNVTDSVIDEALCFRARILTAYCVAVFVISLVLNSTLLLTFINNKHLRTPYNVFIIALTSVNLLSTVTVLPLVIVSNIYCR